jgi:eukaryotic-like serine/threonine-protein kinase
MSDPFGASLAGRRLGRYEVLARLASGGMAAVYVARALGVAGFERLFAIKVLHPHLAHEQEFITMFLDEARLAARIRHQNVVPTIDISDTQDAGYYLVMDYIEGDHLGALLQKAYKAGTRLPPPLSMRIIVDALEGLGAAHALTDEHGRRINLVHRDVSPHNIMVSTDGIARITDFGVAKAEVRLSTTRQGQFKGKLAYMAPEHASTGEADQRSDLFSAAIILWECLTGTRLFRAENQAATLNKICIEPIPMPSSVDASLAPFDTIMARALARDPEERFQTAEEFAEAIEERAETLGGLANQRAVAKLVREYAAEKIERDSELIRSAIAEVAVTGPVPEPLPHVAEAPHAAPVPPLPAPPLAAPPITAPEPVLILEDSAPSRWPFWLFLSLALVAAGVGAAVMVRDAPPEVRSSPLAPSTATVESSAGGSVLPEQPPSPTDMPVAVPEPVQAEEAAAGETGTKPADTETTAEDSSSSGTEGARRDAERNRRPATGDRPADRSKRPKTGPVADPELLLNPYRSTN